MAKYLHHTQFMCLKCLFRWYICKKSTNTKTGFHFRSQNLEHSFKKYLN